MQVIGKEVITSTSFKRPLVFGKGNVQRIAEQMQRSGLINCLVIGSNMLSGRQQHNLEQELGIKVYDRYSIVLRIFQERACTKEARLQTALAEIPYIRARLRQMHDNRGRYGPLLDQVGGSVDMYFTQRKGILVERDRKLRQQLAKLELTKEWRTQNRRQKVDIPIVAVVGYTNCGKTSLIRQITKDESLIPLDKLFATLDVTYHRGRFDSGQNLFFMDTIGFISNIPTGLVSAFNASLQEIRQAHLIVHIYDVSHPDLVQQKETVNYTLNKLIRLPDKLSSTILNVGNKIDLVKGLSSEQPNTSEIQQSPDLNISVTQLINMKPLKDSIEKRVNENFGRLRRRLRIRSGGVEYGWLMKNSVIDSVQVDEQDANYLLAEVQILEKYLNKALHSYPQIELLNETYQSSE
jgi:GTP-binding protein HflX